MVVFHIDMVNCLSPRVLEPYRGEEAAGEMPTIPAFWASRLAGPPKSKSLGAMMAFAPCWISCTATFPTVTGSLLPSRLTNASFFPRTPPFLLISSTASWAPRTAGSSSGAWMPGQAQRTPNKDGVCAGARLPSRRGCAGRLAGRRAACRCGGCGGRAGGDDQADD